MSYSESSALREIMKIIALPGEQYTDGECLDLIIEVLKELGMPIDEEIDRQRELYEDPEKFANKMKEGE